MSLVPYRFCCALMPMLVLCTAPAAAQNYPVKPIRIIVPYAAGGGTDVVYRIKKEIATWSKVIKEAGITAD